MIMIEVTSVSYFLRRDVTRLVNRARVNQTASIDQTTPIRFDQANVHSFSLVSSCPVASVSRRCRTVSTAALFDPSTSRLDSPT